MIFAWLKKGKKLKLKFNHLFNVNVHYKNAKDKVGWGGLMDPVRNTGATWPLMISEQLSSAHATRYRELRLRATRPGAGNRRTFRDAGVELCEGDLRLLEWAGLLHPNMGWWDGQVLETGGLKWATFIITTETLFLCDKACWIEGQWTDAIRREREERRRDSILRSSEMIAGGGVRLKLELRERKIKYFKGTHAIWFPVYAFRRTP